MSKHTMTGAPVCTWVAVTDASGRTRMEARWTSAATASTAGGLTAAPTHTSHAPHGAWLCCISGWSEEPCSDRE